MTFEKWIWVAIGTVLVCALGTYQLADYREASFDSFATPIASGKHAADSSFTHNNNATYRGDDHNNQSWSQIDTANVSDPSPSATVSEIQQKIAFATRQSLLHAVNNARERQARLNSNHIDSEVEFAGNNLNVSEPLPVEMSFEQYRQWAKISGALANRDYKKVETMLDGLNGVFSQDMVEAILDTAVQDYADYLGKISQARCDGYNAESVWRKTIFMSFALVRMNRASAHLEHQAKRARQLCGYAG